jgi:hypothetical protein
MQFTIFVLLVIVAAVSANFAANVDQHFATFKTKFMRKYADAEEESRRRAIFYDNMVRADKLNELNGEPVFGVTKFADWTEEEFSVMRGVRGTPPKFNGRVHDFSDIKSTGVGIPSYVNWADSGKVTPVKNQGQCGSCWAFSTAETFESQWAMNGNALWEFSVQQIASCTTTCNGCGGGWQQDAYQYVAGVVTSMGTGIGSAAWAPYVQSMLVQCTGPTCTQPCSALNMTQIQGNNAFYTGPYASIGVDGSGNAIYKYANTPCQSGLCQSQNTSAVALALANYGPAAIVVNAANWGLYTGGVLTQAACGGYASFNMDHAVQLIGYNAGATNPYWIVRNSWATNWGINGYIALQYPQNTCGFANQVTQITITNSQ